MSASDIEREMVRAGVIRALNRYGHHDLGCSERDVYTADRPCACGFNEALQAALEGREPFVKPSGVARRPLWARTL